MSSVYLVACWPYVKLGITSDLARRIQELRARRGCQVPSDLATAEPLVLIHEWPSGGWLEKPLHDALEDDRAIGEWYHCSERMIRWVNRQRQGTFSPGAIAAIREVRSPQTWWRWPDGTPRIENLALSHALNRILVTDDQPQARFVEKMAHATGIFDPSAIVVNCGKCGATADLDGSTRDGLPRGWERFIVRGERRYACPVCVEAVS